MADRLALSVNGKQIECTEGASVAAAVMQIENDVTRTSVTGEPRGPLCGMGVCFECRVTIDGVAHQRSCQPSCMPNARVQTRSTLSTCDSTVRERGSPLQREFDIVVVGAGPAGVAAACTAAEAGKRVAMVDDNPRPGGQIWRHDAAKSKSPDGASWLDRLQKANIDLISNAQIYAVPTAGLLQAETPDGPVALRPAKVILACGARERFLPFPGWTLPGVFGAGGLQALVKSGYPIAGKRVVVAGSGPLLLAVAAFMARRGADVRVIAEQAPRSKLVRFGASLLWHQPRKLSEAIGLKWQLRGIGYRTGCWPVRASGTSHLAAVTLTDGARTWNEPCDALACGFGLIPNAELPMLMGCVLEYGFVRVNNSLETSVSGVYAVGELTGVGGLDKAILEGQIAGQAAAGRLDVASVLASQRVKMLRFASLLDDTFALRDELRSLPDEHTIVCRCEDVTFGRLQQYHGWRDAKLQTRCGMGPCQGRICGPALQLLFGWSSDSVRPPIFPTALANLQ